MPRISEDAKRQRMERVWLTVKRHPHGVTESEIAQATRIDRRTVNNYLNEMRDIGRIEKEGTLWFPLDWEETRLQSLELTPEEAYALYLGSRLLVKQHDKHNEPAEAALLKLADRLTADASIGYEISQAAAELAQRPNRPGYESVFQTMVRGYIYRKRVKIRYRPLNGRSFETTFETYLMEPSALGYATYVIGYSSTPDARRAYKLERIESAEMTRHSYRVPVDFPGLEILQNAWSIFMGEETVTVKLRFHPQVRERVLETHWHPSQKTNDDPEQPGYLLWQATVADTTDMLPWIRGWGSRTEVLSPPELRAKLTEESSNLSKLYTPPPALSRPFHLLPYAKTNRDTGEIHLLLYHLLDVGQVAQAMWQHAVTPRVRQHIANLVGLDIETTGRLMAFLVGLREVLVQAHELRQLGADSPIVDVALHRLLLAILHRVFGPNSYRSWVDLWSQEQWDLDMLVTYLDEWHHRFDLFDATRPFYQSNDDRVAPKSILCLKHGNGYLHNPLFDHDNELNPFTLSPAESARVLITVLSFGLSGTSSVTTKPRPSHRMEVCTGDVIIMAKGDSLWQTQMLNLVRYPDEQVMPHQDNDLPAWEMANPFAPDRSTPNGYLDYLTWQGRKLLLFPEAIDRRVVVAQVKMAPALVMGRTNPDPMKHYWIDKKREGYRSLKPSEEKQLWRDSAALFSISNALNENIHPPGIFQWLNHLVVDGYLDPHHTFRCSAKGLSCDKGKAEFLLNDSMPLPLIYFKNDKLVERLTDLLARTENIASILYRALRVLGVLLHEPTIERVNWKDVSTNIKSEVREWLRQMRPEQNYWAALDIPFQELIVTLPDDPEAATRKWNALLKDTATETFEHVATQVEQTPRGLKAAVIARGLFHYLLNEQLPQPTQEVA